MCSQRVFYGMPVTRSAMKLEMQELACVTAISSLEYEKEHLMRENRVLYKSLVNALFLLLLMAACSMLTAHMPFPENLFVTECMLRFCILPFFGAACLRLLEAKRTRDNLRRKAPRD